MSPEEDQRITLVLPAMILAELNSRAAARGAEPSELMTETFRAAMSKDESYWRQMTQRVKSIDDALAQGEPEDWPEDLGDCLVVSSLLGVMIEKSAEAYLMEMSGEKMDIVELICRQRGLSYEECVREAMQAKLRDRSLIVFDWWEEDDEDNPADWWKEEAPQ